MSEDGFDDTTNTKIAVIESKWHGDGIDIRKNASVRPMFDVLSDLHFGNTHEYIYEMVATPSALKDAIKRASWDRNISVLYLAAHGSPKGLHLHGYGEPVVSVNSLVNMLKPGGTRRRLKGLYLGACMFGTAKVAKGLLQGDGRLRWVAGYTHSPDFFDGTALDVMFFNAWLRQRQENEEARTRDTIELVAKELSVTCRGLINTRNENGYDDDDDDAPGMGLSIFVRARGRNGGVIDLLRNAE